MFEQYKLPYDSNAYYLGYKNPRADYVKAIRDKIDWNKVAELYDKAIG